MFCHKTLRNACSVGWSKICLNVLNRNNMYTILISTASSLLLLSSWCHGSGHQHCIIMHRALSLCCGTSHTHVTHPVVVAAWWQWPHHWHHVVMALATHVSMSSFSLSLCNGGQPCMSCCWCHVVVTVWWWPHHGCHCHHHCCGCMVNVNDVSSCCCCWCMATSFSPSPSSWLHGGSGHISRCHCHCCVVAMSLLENCTGKPTGTQSLTHTQAMVDPYPWVFHIIVDHFSNNKSQAMTIYPSIPSNPSANSTSVGSELPSMGPTSSKRDTLHTSSLLTSPKWLQLPRQRRAWVVCTERQLQLCDKRTQPWLNRHLTLTEVATRKNKLIWKTILCRCTWVS